MRWSVFLCALFALHNVKAHRFGYSRSAQSNWKSISTSCDSSLQSPIEVNSKHVIPLKMPALEMIRYHNLLPGPIVLHNNGHSASLSIPELSKLDPHKKYVPYVFGAKLNNEYELEGLHFHWGDKNNVGSEHIMNDVQYPMEMHIIHRNRKYSSLPEALNYTDGLTVLGFFFQIREDENKGLNSIVKYLHLVKKYDSKVLINETFTLSSLIEPEDHLDNFYTYQGSLTTPPCSEAVTWILFPDPLSVSLNQMQRFRRLRSDEENKVIKQNFRQVQKLGPRRIFVRKLKPTGVKYNPKLDYSQWEWLERNQ